MMQLCFVALSFPGPIAPGAANHETPKVTAPPLAEVFYANPAAVVFRVARRQVEARYRGVAEFSCCELHTVDPLGQNTWRITINFERPSGGDPVQWYLWPFGHIQEEELRFGARRLTWPPK